MISLKKTMVITIIALVLGSFAGFNIGKLAFRKEKAPERMDDKKIEQGASMLQKDLVALPKQNKAGSSMPASPDPVSIMPSVSSEGVTISVSSQAPGTTVEVAKISLASSGWVVIHEESNGVPGKILGARRFEKGVHSGNVELLRNTESGKIYFAVIHSDDQNHTFDYKSDLPLKDASGGLVMTKFKAMLATTLQ